MAQGAVGEPVLRTPFGAPSSGSGLATAGLGVGGGNSSTSHIWSPSGYDDDGLVFTVFLGSFLVIVFGTFFAVVLSTSVLWVKRLYRPNHTVKPLPGGSNGATQSPLYSPNVSQPRLSPVLDHSGAVEPAAEREQWKGPDNRSDPSEEEGDKDQHGGGALREERTLPPLPSSTPSPGTRSLNSSAPPAPVPLTVTQASLSILSPTVKVNVTAYAPTSRQREHVTRIKRLGVSLPFRSAFFQFPTFDDWRRVEERSLPYLIGVEGLLAASAAGGSTSPPLGPTDRGDRQECRTEDSRREKLVSPVPGSIAGRREMEWNEGERPGATSTAAPLHQPIRSERGEALQSAGSHSVRSYGSTENEFNDMVEAHDAVRSGEENEHEAVDVDNAEVISLSGSPIPAQTPTPTTSPPLASQHPVLPKTPLDPQVSLYLFTLKYFISVLVLGMIFTIWICPISASDNYIGQNKVRRDSRVCIRHNFSQRRCESLSPYCTYEEDGRCVPVAVHGVYEFTVQNISPGSYLWWAVALLNVGFSVVFLLLTVYYVRQVAEFVDLTMKVQLQRAMGYRVSCVRGLSSAFSAEESFRQKFLTESAYFRSASASASHRSSSSNNDSSRDRTPSPSARREHRAGEEEEVLESLECCGIRSLYSSTNCMKYYTTRADAIFTQPGRVRYISFTRNPPPGIYPAITEAERAKSALQNAVAQEKALQRQHRMAHGVARNIAPIIVPEQNGMVVVDIDDEELPQLLIRKPFPSCLKEIPAVPYLERKFRLHAEKLNQFIRRVPEQRAAGSVFVVFSDARSAFEFVNLFNLRYSRALYSTSAVIAGPASGVIPGNLPVGRFTLYVRVFLLTLLFVVLLFFWSVPVGLLSSLDNIELVPVIGPHIYSAYISYLPPSVQNIVTAYLPVAVLALFNTGLPYIIRWMVGAMGVFNETERNSGQLNLQYLFMVLTAVIFQAALQGGLSELRSLLSEMNGDALQNFFVACVTPQGGYWYAKVILATGVSAWMEVIDIVSFLQLLLGRSRAYVQRRYDALFEPCNFDYAKIYSFDLLILSIGVLFHMTVPLLTLFAAIYFVVRYATMRQRLFERYRPHRRPLEDCTDFGISAQVLRHVMALFTLSEFCGVWLMHLRRHRGALLLCALTCVGSVGLWFWVWQHTRLWSVSLCRVREFARTGHSLSPFRSRLNTPQPCGADPNAAPGEGRSDSATTPREDPLTVEEEEEEEERLSEGGEPLEVFTVMEEPSAEEANPFSGHLLPRQKSHVARYQPKHQRLAVVDVNGEVQRMKETEFIVERYWDSAISWFETDHEVEEVHVVEG